MARLSLLWLVLFLSGCASSGKGGAWFNPATWFTDAEGRKVSKLKSEESTLEDHQFHAATIESFKTVTALAHPTFPLEKKIKLGEKLAGNTYSLLSQVEPLTFGEVAEAEQLVDGLLSDLAEARARQAEVERGYARVGGTLREVRLQLDRQVKKAKAEADANAALANQLKTERLLKYASWAGSVLLTVGLFAYRMNLLNLQAGIGHGLARLQRKFGAQDEDVLALKSEIDAAISAQTQRRIAAVVRSAEKS
jgi:hypothetical protein